MVRHKFIVYDLEADPLQIKTDSAAGSGDILALTFYSMGMNDINSWHSLGHLAILFDDPLKYRVWSCSGHWDFKTLASSPNEQNKIWTLIKTSGDLIIECNGKKVLDLAFKEANCDKKWSKYIAKIVFWSPGEPTADDNASDEYRAAPRTCAEPPAIPTKYSD